MASDREIDFYDIVEMARVTSKHSRLPVNVCFALLLDGWTYYEDSDIHHQTERRWTR